jgi:glycosyltransferase involved in cell wall biosynthesis
VTAPISVVTPFYNTAKYIAECIESVLAQTRADFEYVLLDNCSTDGSRAIAERYAARDPRIRLERNQELLPQVPNYNRALSLISPSSRFTKLVQADDTIFPRCLEDMVGLAEANPSIGIVGSYYLHGKVVKPIGMPYPLAVLSGREVCRRYFTDKLFVFGSPTSLLYRSDLVRGRAPFYREGRFHEDTEACFEILAGSDFGFVPQLLSFLRVEESSIMGSVASFGPSELDKLILFRLYGRALLDDDEYQRLWAEHESDYRRLLADGWLRRREAAFWDYHRRGLATVGAELDRGQIARDGIRLAVELALSPTRIGQAIWRRIRR